MTPPTISNYQGALIVCVLGALGLSAFYHNRLIDREMDLAPGRFAAGIHVVAGTFYTLAAATIILAVVFGLESALWAIFVILVCFGVSGGPMVFGELVRNAKIHFHRQEQISREQTKSDPLKELEYDDRG